MAMISAHRGGGEVYPAETYEAYALTAASGVEYVEFDVRRLGDGSLVCFHEARIGTAPLARLTYRELCARAGYEVPLAKRVMELVAGRARGHVDLKETGGEREVVAMAMDAFGPTRFVVTTLDDGSLLAIHRAYPDVATVLSLGRGPGDVPLHRLPGAIVADLFPAGRIRRCAATGASVNRNLVPWGVLGRCAAMGIATMVWTVDRITEIDRTLSDSRVDIVVTNRPLLALERRARLTT